jgi:hypothetical protein
VGNLVSKVPEQRSIGFAHLMAPTLALGIIGFGEIDSDEGTSKNSDLRGFVRVWVMAARFAGGHDGAIRIF